MDRGRTSSSKHARKHPKKSSKKSKKGHRRARDDSSRYSSSSSMQRLDHQNYKIVEYSDVSSEDFSAPEAGEIEDEEIFTLSDTNTTGYGLHSKNGTNNSRSVKVDNGNTVKSSRNDVANVPRLNFVMSPSEVRKVIIGSPISSSMSSNSKSNSRQHMDVQQIRSPNEEDEEEIDGREDVEDEEDEEEVDDDEEEDRRRRKNKKSKKKKNKKKKKKRKKSISSVESISENESLLDDVNIEEVTLSSNRQLLTPTWEKSVTYTPIKPSPMSPATPPLRPNSTISMYSDNASRRINSPPSSSLHGTNKYIASPHTPPIVPKKSSYHSPVDVDLSHSSSSLHHSSHHYHHSHHHQPRSPPDEPPPSRRISKSPGTVRFYFCLLFFC